MASHFWCFVANFNGVHLRTSEPAAECALSTCELRRLAVLCTIDQRSCSVCPAVQRRIEECGVPPPPPNMECIFEEDFSPSVREFFNRIFSNDSDFFEEFHKARGDQRYMVSPWQKHSLVGGNVRHTTFVSPVKSRVRVGLITPSKTDCTQNQRYCVYGGDHLIFESSQVGQRR